MKYYNYQIPMGEPMRLKDVTEKVGKFASKSIIFLFTIPIFLISLLIVKPWQKILSFAQKTYRSLKQILIATFYRLLEFTKRPTDEEIQEERWKLVEETQKGSGDMMMNMIREKNIQLEDLLAKQKEERQRLQNQLITVYKKFTEQDTILVKQHKENIGLLVENDRLRKQLREAQQEINRLASEPQKAEQKNLSKVEEEEKENNEIQTVENKWAEIEDSQESKEEKKENQEKEQESQKDER